MANLNENKLWKWFSRFIRLRDANENGHIRCFTCGAWRFWTASDCCHGVSRRHRATKYDEKNNHAGCATCNQLEDGNQEVYKIKVDERYGPGTWDELVIKSHQVTRWTQAEVDEMAKEYQQKAQEIAKEKGLKINS